MSNSRDLEHILKLMFDNVYSVKGFLKDVVYESGCLPMDVHSSDSSQEGLNLLTIALSGAVRCDCPQKLRELPQTEWGNFLQFYEFSSYRRSMMNDTCEFFNEIVYEIQSYSCLDNLYNHIGDKWLLFLITKCAVFLTISQNLMLQIIGIPVVDMISITDIKNDQKRLNEQPPIALAGQNANSAKASVLDDHTHLSDTEGSENYKIEEVIQISIPWKKILFCKTSSAGFPREHIIEKLAMSVNERSAACLIDIIIESCLLVCSENSTIQNVLSHLKSATLISIMQSFLTKHRRCHFARMLDAHCGPQDSTNVSEPLHCYTPKVKVQQFLSSIIHRVIPLELLGSNHNKIRFQAFCKVFLDLCRSDQLSIVHLMHCMRTTDCKWLPQDIRVDLQKVLLATVLKWMFCDYLLECLRGCFYITDADVRRKELFYYRKETWKNLQDVYLKETVNDGIIRELSSEEMERITSQSSSRVCLANGRLLPKKHSMRLVMSFENKSNKKYNLRYWIQNYLNMLQYILKHDLNFNTCGIRGQADFHERWKSFINVHRVVGKMTCNEPLYFVKLDIQSCFTSIKHNHLENVLKEIVGKNSRWRTTSLTLRFYFVFRVVNQRLKRTYKRITIPSHDSFLYHLKNLAMRNRVVVALTRKVIFKKRDIVENVLAYYRNTFIKFGKHYYHLLQGVAQGNPLSPVLCNLYYAHMATKYFQDFMPPAAERDLLLRYVDDYIYVSSEKDKVIKFSSAMQRGIVDYNCNISVEKTITNFVKELSLQDQNVNEERVTKIPWFGFLINTVTLEVSANYSCYADKAIKNCISFSASRGKEGLRKKIIYLSDVTRQRILFDGQILSKKCVMKNLYQFSLLCAFRMHCLTKKLPKCDGPHNHKEFFFDLIISCIDHICQSLFRLKSRKKIKYYIRARETKWICLRAFITKLKRHSLKYHHILKLLLIKQEEFEEVVGQNRSRRILCIIQPLFPKEFRNIQD